MPLKNQFFYSPHYDNRKNIAFFRSFADKFTKKKRKKKTLLLAYFDSLITLLTLFNQLSQSSLKAVLKRMSYKKYYLVLAIAAKTEKRSENRAPAVYQIFKSKLMFGKALLNITPHLNADNVIERAVIAVFRRRVKKKTLAYNGKSSIIFFLFFFFVL